MARTERRDAGLIGTSARARQDDLLDEAARQFNSRGVTQTSLTEISDRLGVSRAALYYYVEDREDLVFKVYRRSLEVLARHLGEAAQTGRETLDIVDQLIATSLDPVEPEIAALSELGLLRRQEREVVLALYEGIVARLAGLLEAGASVGEARSCDYDTAARCIISMIFWVPLAERWNAPTPIDRQAIVRFTCDLARWGVAARRSRSSRGPEIDLSPLLPRATAAFDREGERENRRERILLVASRLFNAKGIDTTSLDEIASDLGTNKKALYRYVGDKQALISACYERAFKIAFFISDETGRLGLSAADEMDLQQRTHALAQQNPDICPLRHLRGLDALSPQARSSVLDAAGRFTAISRARATAAQREGDMRGMDVEAFLLLGTGPSAWLGKPLRDHDVSQRAQTAESVADFVKLGLAPLPGGVGQS